MQPEHVRSGKSYEKSHESAEEIPGAAGGALFRRPAVFAAFGASVVSARRSGCTATFDELNKFFTLANMPVATSQYWNNIYGWEPGEGEADAEGRQVMRTLARNMAFLMKSIAMGKKEIGTPLPEEPRVWTNFTR